MKRFILNKKNKKGIIAEIIGDNMLKIEKRKIDKHPINIVIRGQNYDVVANDTLTGEAEHIECIDGKINTANLLIVERKDKEEEDGKEKEPKEDEQNEDS